jgi:hypothetical protein
VPVSVVIHSPHRLIYMRLANAVSREEILSHRQRVSQHPQFDPAFDVLVDLREADLSNLSGEVIASLAATSTLRRSARRVFIADTEAAFGVSRMYDTWASMANSAQPLMLVRTIEEALQSLGLSAFDPSVGLSVS